MRIDLSTPGDRLRTGVSAAFALERYAGRPLAFPRGSHPVRRVMVASYWPLLFSSPTSLMPRRRLPSPGQV